MSSADVEKGATGLVASLRRWGSWLDEFAEASENFDEARYVLLRQRIERIEEEIATLKQHASGEKDGGDV